MQMQLLQAPKGSLEKHQLRLQVASLDADIAQAPLLPRAPHEPPGAPPMPAPRTRRPRRSSAPEVQIPLWGSDGVSEEPPGSEMPSSGSPVEEWDKVTVPRALTLAWMVSLALNLS